MFLIFNLVFTLLAHAQSAENILSSVYDKFMSKEPLHYRTTYNLYKGEESNKVIESYKGNFYKNSENDIFLQIKDTDVVSTDQFSLKINHREKAILVTNPEDKVKKDFNMKGLLTMYDLESLNNNHNFWEIKLTSKKNFYRAL